MPNRNVLWTDVFVDELARAGLKAVCIAPGSRSTPLTLAFARHGGVKIYTHLDERCAAFFALGLALASDAPVALVCTSGTAAANFFPAIVEAHMSRVPLLVLTADRPPELRHSGANQTIDQIKMYGDYALWSVDAPLPEAAPSALTIRSLRTLAARAYARANGIRKGVVHINLPFRKPLEPVVIEGDIAAVPADAAARADGESYAQFVQPARQEAGDLSAIYDLLAAHRNGVVLAGIKSAGDDACAVDAILRFARAVGYPLIADAVSGVRYGHDSSIIAGYETFPHECLPKPDVIVRFGDLPVSTWLNQYISASQPRYYIHITPSGEWADDAHLVTHVVNGMPGSDFPLPATPHEVTDAARRLNQVEQTAWAVLEQAIDSGAYFDGAAVYDVVDLVPPESTLFMGNSLPVRLLDQFGRPQSKRIHVYANRGASGIDGNISTALGAGAARPDAPLVAIVGDITFYHDMNGLLAVQRNGIPITIVLLNNDGGGIFHRLPIRNHEPDFTDLFVMPHGLAFEHAARLYGLDYVRADDRETFRQAFSESVNNRLSRIIEVRTDAQHDLKRRQEIMDAVQQRIAELSL